MPAADPTSPLTDDLTEWLAALGRPAAGPVRALAGDVSLRRYFRVALHAGGSAIAAYYPSEIRMAQARFDAAAALLESVGVRVPRRLASDRERGWSLVEDLGAATLYDERHSDWESLEPLLAVAVDVVERIGRLPAAAVAALDNPRLDHELLRRELAQTEALVLAPAGAHTVAAEAAALSAAFDALCERLAREPLRACHRDFMARNLVRVGDDVAVLDFQDLRLGPAPYDLASLLNDSLFPPPPVEARLLERATGSPRPSAGYRRAVAQRALKAAGTFAAFAARGSDRHVALIPPTLARATPHLLALPETAATWRAVVRRCGAALRLPKPLLD